MVWQLHYNGANSSMTWKAIELQQQQIGTTSFNKNAEKYNVVYIKVGSILAPCNYEYGIGI